MDQSFSTRTRREHRTTGQLVTVLIGVVALGIVLVNAIWLTFADDRGERLMFVGVGTFMVIAAGWFYRWLRRYERYELTLDAQRLGVVVGGTVTQWSWDEVTSIAVIRGGETNMLTIEDERARRADNKAPALASAHRVLTKQSPVGVTIPIGGLDANEADIVHAIRTFSHGRFPDGERNSYRVFSKE